MATNAEKKVNIKKPIFFADREFYVDRSTVLFEFPNEFKRGWFRQLDWRFLVILLFTWIIEVGLLLLLVNYTKNYEAQSNVNKIQKQFARLLLKEFTTENFSALEEYNKNTALVTSTDWKAPEISIEEISNDTNIETETVVTRPPDEYFRQGKVLESDKQSLLSRKAARKNEDRFGSALTREVNRKGLLVYFTDEKKHPDDEDILKILSYGKKNEKYLLSSMDKISLVRYQNVLSKLGGPSDLKNLKGPKSFVSYHEELASLTPLAKIELASTDKNDGLEYSEVSNISTKKNNKTTRTAEHVTHILMSHNRAIQDCFNRVLKKNPGLKGKVVVRISVNPGGLVEQVQILESTIQNEKMLRCMTNRIQRWRDFGACDPELGTVSYKQSYVFGY